MHLHHRREKHEETDEKLIRIGFLIRTKRTPIQLFTDLILLTPAVFAAQDKLLRSVTAEAQIM